MSPKGAHNLLKMPKDEHIFDIPDDIRGILQLEGVLEAFELRPLSQQKGYVHWLHAAKDVETRGRRIIHIIEELHAGAYTIPAQKEHHERNRD